MTTAHARAKFQIGHAEEYPGCVILNSFATGATPAMHIIWTPSEARTIARELLRVATEAETPEWKRTK